jgi:phytoene dehydrogenase-like protein
MNQAETIFSNHVTQAPALEEYDLVILGGGTGSTIAAWTFAGQGRRVAVIEHKYIGGSCPTLHVCQVRMFSIARK